MYKSRLSDRFIWIAIVGMSLLFLIKGIGDKYMADLNKKVGQTISEADTPKVSVIIADDKE